MHEIVLESAALLLALFCLIYSIAAHRELYAPPEGGLRRALGDRHHVFLLLLFSLILSALFTLAFAWARSYQASGGVLTALFTLNCLFHLLLSFLLGLYLRNLTKPRRKEHWIAMPLFALPLLLGVLLLLANLFTGFCFAPENGDVVRRGSFWLLHLCSLVYRLVALVVILREKSLSRVERTAAPLFLLVSILGTLVQALWAIPVELFFTATAAFGLMALLERDTESAGNWMNTRMSRTVMAGVLLVFCAVIAMNVLLNQALTSAQEDEIGNVRLDVIRSDLEDTISQAETSLLHVAIEAEKLLDGNPAREEIEAFFQAQRESHLVDGNFMNVYIAGPDWHVVPGFDAPPGFHAAERIWYLGAMEEQGRVYVTEPYLDANTGNMCFTVSVLLSGMEAVVGMDLNFSQAQESILRMTSGTDSTAMIVTSGGLIAGYTDMSLVGQRADEKLPEYAEVLRRVAASQEHGCFRVSLDGRPRIIFSSETDNGWYLILSVDAGTLYAESYRQMVMLVAVNLMTLVLVLVFYLVSLRSRQRTAEAAEEKERFIAGISDQLRGSAAQVLRLSDWQLIRDSEDPPGTVGRIREAGEQLTQTLNTVNAWSDLMRQQRQEEERARRRAASAGAPSLKVRNTIILTLLAAFAVGLFICIRVSLSWAEVRMNREADTYQNQLGEWITQQQSILYMFTDTIAAQPELMGDYDKAVEWLADVSRHYPEISACYMANPYSDPPVIMNTGWLPGEDYRPETRPWYKATERSPSGFSISAPYLDAQTGAYCITFSRVVYTDGDEFLGIFGIDFFLDKLIHVLGESYTRDSYAFLVDADGTIINHPNKAYEMEAEKNVSVEDTEYAEAYHREGITTLWDYTGRPVACLSRGTDTGFTVLVANRWWSVYGIVVLSALAFLALFSLCILFIVLLINRLLRWQEAVNRQLREAAETATNAGQAKSQFLAQMSHEIRTPMNAIIGLDNIALREPDLSPRTRDQLEKIGASARHLLGLINDILDMSRIESGRMTLKEEEFSFREFLDQIAVIIGGQCADKGLQFDSRVLGQAHEYFLGDALKLKQVLINILGNSVKFTEAPGTVTFTAEEIARGEEDCTLRFTMKDTGIGMDKEFLPRLFEAFSQEDATSTNKYGGSGLGMAITKSIVEMMGGEIAVESEKGLGSTFTVTVALKRAAAPAVQEEEPEAVLDLAGRHVLIAEDLEQNAEILMDQLEMEDITAEWAQNGQIAVDLIAKSEAGHFDAVLMDMRMPVMDGLTATREIRKLNHPDAGSIPIIALTANAFEEDVQLCLQAGMDGHVAKPVDTELLLRTMRRFIAAREKGE